MIEVCCHIYKRHFFRVDILIMMLVLGSLFQVEAFVRSEPNPDVAPLRQDHPISTHGTTGPASQALREIDELVELTLSTAGIDPTQLPLLFRQRVHQYIHRHTVRDRNGMKAMLRRADAYLPMIKRIFRQQALPTYFAYIPFVESAFHPRAHNAKSGARGLWQLMAATARDYGLTVSDELDERLDPERATQAAARHLRLLRKRFGEQSYLHILAAYNYGEGNFAKALRRANTTDIWPPFRQRYLPYETRNYLAQMASFWVLFAHPDHFKLTLARQETPSKRPRTVRVQAAPSARSVSRRARLVVFDFKNILADQKYAAGVAEIFRKELAALGALIIATNDEMPDALAFADDTTVLEMGKRLKVDRAVVGSVVKFGETLTINVKAIDMQTGAVSAAQSLSAKDHDALPPLVRQLSLTLMPSQTTTASRKKRYH